MDNLFSSLPQSLPSELIEILAESPTIRIERIVSTGHASPPEFWYDQSEHEWVAVLQGEARLQLAGEPDARHLKPGDFLLLPAHTKHRVEWTTPHEPTVWLAVFFTDV